MTANRVWPACVAALVCVAAALLSTSQGPAPQAAPPQGAGMPQITFDLSGTLPKQRTVHITGENPGPYLREVANGPVVSNLNFWRVTWSPVGTGPSVT